MSENLISIDAGTGFVKCVSAHLRKTFPSIYAKRPTTRWEAEKEKEISAVGFDAKSMVVYPETVMIKTVLEGRIADEVGFIAIVKEAIRQLGKENDVNNLTIVMGLPYGAASQKTLLENLIKKHIKPKQVAVIPQAIGTLLSENQRTGIVLSIGQGTSELVLFENLKPITGVSIPQACDYLYNGDELSYLDYETSLVDKRKIDALTTILANKLAIFKTKLSKEYDIYVSGGGVLIPGLWESLQKKIPDGLRIVQDPVYSNAIGLYELGKLINIEDQPIVNH